MQFDKTEIRQQNQAALDAARKEYNQRLEDEHSCFETALMLNRVAIILTIQDDLDEDDMAALGEILAQQNCMINAAYAHYRLRAKN